MYYDDDLFFWFFKFIEKNLPKGFVFIYDYPQELAALAKVENGRAKHLRFIGMGRAGKRILRINLGRRTSPSI